MDHLSSTNLMCAILLLFYASGTVKGAGFDEACGGGNECTGTNNECSSSKCACTSVSFRNKDNDQCIPNNPTNTRFRVEVTSHTLLDKGKIVLEATCVDGEPAGQCADDLAECRDDSGFKCLCKAANYKSGSACTVRKAPGATCASGECVTNAMCSTTCTCKTGYTATPTTTPTSCESSDAAIIIAHMYVFNFGIVASLYFLV